MSGTPVRVTPLFGARTALVEIGNVHILLNCGWDVSFDAAPSPGAAS